MNSRAPKPALVAPPPVGAQPLSYDSRELFAVGKEVLIHHAGEVYRLRVTRQNKLILTK